MTSPAPSPSRNLAPLVSLGHCPDYDRSRVETAVHKLLAPLGGMGAFVRPGQRVLLKPNLIVPRPAEAAVTTHPEVIRAVAREVLEAGAIPFIGDSPAFSSTWGVARASGVATIAQELGIEIVDLGRRPRTRVIDPGGPFEHAPISAAALEADAIINLPKIKAHTQMRVSLGSKNLFGCIAGKRKAFFHFRTGPDPIEFGRMLIALTRYLAPVLTLEDGIVILERDGPTHGDPRPAGFLAASADVVAADLAVLALLGVAPESVPYLQAARSLKFGPTDLNQVELAGDPLEALRVPDFVKVDELTSIQFTLGRVIQSISRQMVFLYKAWRQKPS
ncbi:MAG TPA: DUF362 domain-containing protein [Candidatus Sumerlaeota bacterium]|nr:DUF362 domain-containing protein [Candidatus Sumerlaeota bacterium]